MAALSVLVVVLPAPGLRRSLKQCVTVTYLHHHGRNGGWVSLPILQAFLRRSVVAAEGGNNEFELLSGGMTLE